MTGHTEVPNLIYELMECCEITELQFLILLAAYRWLNRAAGRVDSFSAERVCRFYKWDATEAKLREVRRAVHDLVKYGIVSRDYRKGDKRPYHLWLPKENETLSLCIARVRDPVSDPVSEENEVTDAGSVNSEEEPSVGVRDPVSENAPLLSATNQYDQNQERERAPCPLWGFLPPPFGGTPKPWGFFQSQRPHRRDNP